MLTTLENIRLAEGDKVTVSIGAASYEVEIIDASDRAKLKVQLETGAQIWIGRKCVESIECD